MSDSPDFRALKESLLAAALGPFFPDWEFFTLFGLERARVEAIARTFSSATPVSADVELALGNAVANLLGYPHGQDAAWAQWLSVTPSELQVAYSKWRASSIGA